MTSISQGIFNLNSLICCSNSQLPPLSPPPTKQKHLPSSPITPVDLNKTYAGSPVKISIINGKQVAVQRIKRQLKFNLSSSESDSVFAENIITEAAPDEKLKLINPYELVKEYGQKGILMNHLKKRVDVFFQQLVTVYGTGLYFELGATLEQGESGKGLYVENEGLKHKICTRNAAHSSTLPCLTAYDKKAWDIYKRGETEKPVGFVFAKESVLFLESNSTMVMPRDVNEADMAIDGDRRTSGGLREKALEIINQAAIGKINPEEGLLLFVDAMLAKIDEKVGVVSKMGVQCALGFYQTAARQIKSETEDPCYFNTLLDLHNIEKGNADLRESIHAIRYRAIRRQHLAQTQVRKKIRDLQEVIFKKLKKGAHYKLDAFQETLIEKMPTNNDRIRMKKILNFSAVNTVPFKKGPLTRLNNMRKIVNTHSAKFTKTANEIAILFEGMRDAEMKTRARITHKLRKAHGWTKDELGFRLSAAYPNHSITAALINDLEDSSKPTSDFWAEALSTVFKIDSTIYFPNFFYS